MHRIFIFFIALLIGNNAAGQLLPDSIMQQYHATENNSAKGRIINNYLARSLNDHSKETTTRILKILEHFKEQKDELLIAVTEIHLGGQIVILGEYNIALKYFLSAAQRLESLKDTPSLSRCYIALGVTYADAKNYEQAIYYFQKNIAFIKGYENNALYADAENGIADCLVKMKQPDAALSHISEAVKIAFEKKDSFSLAYYLGTQGQVYLGKKEYEIAKSFFIKSNDYAKKYNMPFIFAYNNFDLSNIFFETAFYDSALSYTRKAALYAFNTDKILLMRSYQRMYEIFEKKQLTDSVNKYFRIATMAKDSIYTIEKEREVQALSFQEQIRQEELESEKALAKKERHENIQYALTGLGIITFIIIFLLLSHSFITNTKLIRFFGVVALLLVFEFLNLLLHPFLEHLTGHSPALMLVALSCIAALLVPLHHGLEKWAIKKLVEKNQRIRLAAAKKTIVELEEGTQNVH